MTDGQASFQIDAAKLYALFGSAFGGGNSGQPDPDHPLKPGPWDPVIRIAAKEVLRFGPQPEPWQYGHPVPWITAAFGNELLSLIARRSPAIWDVLGGILRPGEEVSLNPQPLPPVERGFIAALADALVTRVEALAEVSAAVGDSQSSGEERSIIIVGGHVSRLVDEYCGTGFRLVWPFPGPPPWWFRAEVGPREILALGADLNAAAERAFDPAVRQALGDASTKLAQVGIERLG